MLQVKNEILNSLRNTNFHPDYIEYYSNKNKNNNSNLKQNTYSSNNSNNSSSYKNSNGKQLNFDSNKKCKKNNFSNKSNSNNKNKENNSSRNKNKASPKSTENLVCQKNDINNMNKEIRQKEDKVISDYQIKNGQPDINLKNNIFNNLKILYDKNSLRSRKRSEQIKRLRSSKSATAAELCANDNYSLENKKENEKNICNSLREIKDDNSLSNKPTHYNKKFYEEDHAKYSLNMNKHTLVIDNTLLNNNVPSNPNFVCINAPNEGNQNVSKIISREKEAQLNISDLDASLDDCEDITNIPKNEENNNLMVLKNINKKNSSFINIKNNLKNKTDSLNNITNSYMMALNGYNAPYEENEYQNQYIGESNANNDENYIKNTKIKKNLLDYFNKDNYQIDKSENNGVCSSVVDNLDMGDNLLSNPRSKEKNKLSKNGVYGNGNNNDIFHLKENFKIDENNPANDLSSIINNSFNNNNPQQPIQSNHSRSKSHDMNNINNLKLPSVKFISR